jgi:hypothetical protein
MITLRLGIESMPGTHMNSFSLFQTPGVFSSYPIQGSKRDALGFLELNLGNSKFELECVTVVSCGRARKLLCTLVFHGTKNRIKDVFSRNISTLTCWSLRARVVYKVSESSILHLNTSNFSFSEALKLRLFGMNSAVEKYVKSGLV